MTNIRQPLHLLIKDINIKSMVPMTSYQSMGPEVRELISEQFEKKADFLSRERNHVTNQNRLIELEFMNIQEKKKLIFRKKIINYVNIKIENSRKISNESSASHDSSGNT